MHSVFVQSNQPETGVCPYYIVRKNTSFHYFQLYSFFQLTNLVASDQYLM